MAVATMPKPKGGQKPDTTPEGSPAEDREEEEKESSLKVTQGDAQLVGKIAALRKKSVKKLFRDQDVEDFFTHLLLEEMRKETERLKRRKL